MGGGQPYLYDSSSTNRFSQVNINSPYGAFNPKAVSQASFARNSQLPRPKPDGPLINFNQHPDRHLIPIYGRADNQHTMPRNTKKWVTGARNIQLAFRFLELIAAIGVLVCVICIKSTQNTESWIIRLPPSVDTLVTLYAIYHLMRGAKDRTPASSASYHFFALFMDAGLIPFYIFIGMLAHAQYQQVPGTKNRWSTVFDADQSTNQVIQTTWMVAAVNAGLHIVSLSLDLYLIIIFRKIAQLPPDMNPLEDNLTSRRKNKHKYKNSEVSLVGSDKRFSDLTSDTRSIGTPNRMSHGQESPGSKRNSQQISFMQSRDGENGSFSPHNPKTARMSRVSLAENMYQLPSGTSSRIHLHERDHNVNGGSIYRTSPMPADPMMSKRSSAVSSMHTYEDSGYSRSQKHQPSNEDLQDGNWRVLEEDDENRMQENTELHSPQPKRFSKINELTKKVTSDRSYQPVSRDLSDEEVNLSPLRMNPPTPPPQPIQARIATQPLSPPPSHNLLRGQDQVHEDNRTRTMASGVSEETSSSRYTHDDLASDFSGSSQGGPKTRFYGDLDAAMRGVRQGDNSPRPKSVHGSLHYTNSESEYSSYEPARASPAAGRPRPKSQVVSVSGTVIRKNRNGEEDEHGQFNGYARVLSRSGADVADSNGHLGVGKKRREVSGKVVEEGRAGGWLRSGLFNRKSSGFA